MVSIFGFGLTSAYFSLRESPGVPAAQSEKIAVATYQPPAEVVAPTPPLLVSSTVAAPTPTLPAPAAPVTPAVVAPAALAPRPGTPATVTAPAKPPVPQPASPAQAPVHPPVVATQKPLVVAPSNKPAPTPAPAKVSTSVPRPAPKAAVGPATAPSTPITTTPNPLRAGITTQSGTAQTSPAPSADSKTAAQPLATDTASAGQSSAANVPPTTPAVVAYPVSKPPSREFADGGVARPIIASPLIPVAPVVVLATKEKAWVRLDDRRTVIVNKGDEVPGFGRMLESDGKSVKFEKGSMPVTTE